MSNKKAEILGWYCKNNSSCGYSACAVVGKCKPKNCETRVHLSAMLDALIDSVPSEQIHCGNHVSCPMVVRTEKWRKEQKGGV